MIASLEPSSPDERPVGPAELPVQRSGRDSSTVPSGDEGSLTVAWQRGDSAAIEVLVRRHEGALRWYFKRRLGTDGRDEVQALWLRVLAGRHRYRGACSVRTLCFAIARNMCLEEFRRRRHALASMDRFPVAAEFDSHVYFLAAAVPGDKNTGSIVLAITHGEVDFALTRDATEAAATAMIQWHGNWLDSVVLKLGHLGSETSTGRAWVDTVAPAAVVARSKLKRGHGHPRNAVLERAARACLTAGPHVDQYDGGNKKRERDDPYAKSVYRTASSGNIKVRSNAQQFWVYQNVVKP